RPSSAPSPTGPPHPPLPDPRAGHPLPREDDAVAVAAVQGVAAQAAVDPVRPREALDLVRPRARVDDVLPHVPVDLVGVAGGRAVDPVPVDDVYVARGAVPGGSEAGEDAVLARPALDHVVPGARDDEVVPRAAVNLVRAGAGGDPVTAEAGQRPTVVIEQVLLLIVTLDAVVAPQSDDQVPADPPADGVFTDIAVDHIRVRLTVRNAHRRGTGGREVQIAEDGVLVRGIAAPCF